MNLIATALAGISVVVATRSASAAPGDVGNSAVTAGGGITCEPDNTVNTAVSQPDTTVSVTFPGTSPLGKASETPEGYIYVDADCNKPGVLSNVCPGATVKTAQQAGSAGNTVEKKDMNKGTPVTKPATIVTLWFPQLPPSKQVVCVKCPDKLKSANNCKAVITVAAAPPQGPQACAVGGTSITLEINKAGGSAQFKCGNDRTLAPPEPAKAYADDCSKVETLKDMTRSDAPSEGGYLTVKVDKLKNKKLCYLCQPSTPGKQQKAEKDEPCKVYVQVSGSTKFSSSLLYGLALPCLAAMLRLT